MRSNCLLWSLLLYIRLRRKGRRCYLMFRRSDKGWFPHVLVGIRHPVSQRLRIVSRKPPADAPHRTCPPLCHGGWVVFGDAPPLTKP